MKLRFLKFAIALLALAMLCALPLTQRSAQAASAYYIEVDITNQIVTIDDNSNRTESGKVAMMICSTGKSGTPTPTGTFTLPTKRYSTERTEWYYFSQYNCYAKWATRIYSGILFHSVTYNSKSSGPSSAAVNALGYQASHGCVRLRVADAKWIAKNCPAGTKVRIYKSGKRNESLRSSLLRSSWYRSSSSSKPATRDYLTIGDTGSKVTALQKNLITLKLYSGSASGTYNSATSTAVKNFQRYNGLAQTGNADPATVSAIASKASQVSSQYGGNEYKAVVTTQSQQLARVSVKTSLNVRKSASTTATIIAQLSNKTVVTILSKGSTWSKVQIGSTVGYCSNSYLVFYNGTSETLTYEPVVAPTPTPTPEPTPEPTPTPEPEPTPTSEPTEEATPAPSEDPEATPTPTADPTPLPTVDITSAPVTPEPTVTPTPTPVPTPEPTPEPTSTPTPTSTPAPSVTPEPMPTAGSSTLKNGSSGAAVRNLQQGLIALKLYAGSPDGKFGSLTEEAIRIFQRANKLTETGTATPALQQLIFDKAAAVVQKFAGGDYQVTISNVTTSKATIATKTSPLNIRKKSSTTAAVVGKAPKGASVTVLKKGKNWSQVQYGKITGYCLNSYLKFSSTTETVLSYEAVPGAPATNADSTETAVELEVSEETPAPSEAPEVTPGPTPTPEAIPSPEAAETPAPTETTEPVPIAEPTPTAEPLYAVIAREGVKVYAEAEVDEETVIAEPERDSFFTVLERGEEWTLIALDDQHKGYVATADIILTKEKPVRPTATPEPTPAPEATNEPAPIETQTPETTPTPAAPDPEPEAPDSSVELEPPAALPDDPSEANE